MGMRVNEGPSNVNLLGGILVVRSIIKSKKLEHKVRLTHSASRQRTQVIPKFVEAEAQQACYFRHLSSCGLFILNDNISITVDWSSPNVCEGICVILWRRLAKPIHEASGVGAKPGKATIPTNSDPAKALGNRAKALGTLHHFTFKQHGSIIWTFRNSNLLVCLQDLFDDYRSSAGSTSLRMVLLLQRNPKLVGANNP